MAPHPLDQARHNLHHPCLNTIDTVGKRARRRTGLKTIRLGDTPTNAKLAWEENKCLRGLMSQPLSRDGHVYLLDKQYGLTCFELQTGKKLWDDANQTTPRGRNPQATLVWLGDTDRAILLNEEGELILTRRNPRAAASNLP